MYVESTLEYIGSHLGYVENRLGYVGSPLLCIAFTSILVNIRSNFEYFGEY